MNDLEQPLRRWAAGTPGMIGAVDILIEDGWLAEQAFVGTCVVPVDTDTAMIDWVEVADYAAGRLGVARLHEAVTIARRVRDDLAPD